MLVIVVAEKYLKFFAHRLNRRPILAQQIFFFEKKKPLFEKKIFSSYDYYGRHLLSISLFLISELK